MIDNHAISSGFQKTVALIFMVMDFESLKKLRPKKCTLYTTHCTHNFVYTFKGNTEVLKPTYGPPNPFTTNKNI
jgi:hypothetical protein